MLSVLMLAQRIMPGWAAARSQTQELLEYQVWDQVNSLVWCRVWEHVRDPLYGQVDVPAYVFIHDALQEFVEEKV